MIERRDVPEHAAGRLAERPAGPGPSGAGGHPAGLHRLAQGWLAVPARAGAEAPVPLFVVLHGAGGSGRAAVDVLAGAAAAAGALLLAPDSRGRTWDVIEGGFGPDVAALDDALAAIYAEWLVDPCRTVLSGFSDGASYALSLGLANGDRFSHLAAFSPGFMAPGARHGRPPVYVSHGRTDPVLPIDRCSRRIVPRLLSAGHVVCFREFDGGHDVPPEIVRDALAWIARTPSCAQA